MLNFLHMTLQEEELLGAQNNAGKMHIQDENAVFCA